MGQPFSKTLRSDGRRSDDAGADRAESFIGSYCEGKVSATFQPARRS